MKTAFRILARDLGHLARNPVALIVIAGLIVLPALYAWYCIWANWDPYGNTGNIRVAVANADAGADTEALGHIDVGSQVEANLQDDDQLGWEFVSEDEAVQGVESGRYYAAYVIPADFSSDFASVLTGKPEHPTITYCAGRRVLASQRHQRHRNARVLSQPWIRGYGAVPAKDALIRRRILEAYAHARLRRHVSK